MEGDDLPELLSARLLLFVGFSMILLRCKNAGPMAAPSVLIGYLAKIQCRWLDGSQAGSILVHTIDIYGPPLDLPSFGHDWCAQCFHIYIYIHTHIYINPSAKVQYVMLVLRVEREATLVEMDDEGENEFVSEQVNEIAKTAHRQQCQKADLWFCLKK